MQDDGGTGVFDRYLDFLAFGRWSEFLSWDEACKIAWEVPHHWFLFILLAVLFLGLTGAIASGMGLKNIFHDDPDMLAFNRERGAGIWVHRNSPSLLAQGSIAVIITHIFGLAHTLGKTDSEGIGQLVDLWPRMGSWIVGASLISVALAIIYRQKPGARASGSEFRAILGAILGLMLGFFITYVANGIETHILPVISGWTHGEGVTYLNAPTYALVMAGFVLWLVIVRFNRILPCVGLMNLLAFVSFFYAVLSTFFDARQLIGVGILVVFFIMGNGGMAYAAGLSKRVLKFDFEGVVGRDLKSLYPHARSLNLAARYASILKGTSVKSDAVDPDTGMMSGPDADIEADTPRQKSISDIEEDKAKLADWRDWKFPEPMVRPEASGNDPVPENDDELSRQAERVSPREALSNWRSLDTAGDGKKPKLVLVATSGGAYRASFWTGIVLDQLVRLDQTQALPGFARNVRLITGASGGMVTAAYFASMMNRGIVHPGSIIEQLEQDIIDAQDQDFQKSLPDNRRFSHTTKFPVPRDSLSPVAQQLVQRDLLSLFWPFPKENDRGKVLERQWRTLDRPFGALAQGEAEGWRPSILFSPMIVESGTPLLISNLDVNEMLIGSRHASGGDQTVRNSERAIFFDWFNFAQGDFKLRTAVRMNASFPYVSPSTALPTIPYRRVVDAGYYDNYGIDMAVKYLSEPNIRDWILQNTSGVALIEIRAFPHAAPSKGVSASKQSFQWLTTPLDGMLSARGSTMTFRNWQSFRNLQETYRLAERALGREATSTPEGFGFLERFTFELADADISLNWYLPEFELAEMVTKLELEDNQIAFSRLQDFWKLQLGS